MTQNTLSPTPATGGRPKARKLTRALSAGVLGLILGCAGVLTACSGGDGSTNTPEVSNAFTDRTSPPPAPEISDAELSEMLIEKYWKFWDALKEAELGNPDYELFEGLAHGQVLNEILQTAEQRRIDEAPRLGEPVWKSELNISIYDDQQSADIVACVDRGHWVPAEVTNPQDDVVQYTVTFFKVYDDWVVTWIDVDQYACQG